MKTTPHSVLRLVISLGIAIVAAIVAPASASAQILYTTQDDFAGWGSDGIAVIAPTSTPDYDGVTINGLGNTNNGPGQPGAGGSLGGTLNAQSYYTGIYAPGQGSDPFLSALKSASELTLDLSGTLYGAPLLVVYSPAGGYNTYGATSSTSEGSFNLVTYNFAPEAALLNAGGATYVDLGFILAGNSGATFNIDDIAAVPEPSTTAMLGLGGLGLIILLRRRKLAQSF